MSGGRDEIRVGTREREDAVRLLGEHFAEGRLTPTEYEDRCTVAVAAVQRGDLTPLFADLPVPHPACLAPPLAAFPQPPAPVYPQPHAPRAIETTSDKSSVVAGVLQILLPFGVGRFYSGHTAMGVAQLVLCVIGIGFLWSVIDGVILLAAGGTDSYGRPMSR